MFGHLRPVEEQKHENDGIRTDPDLMSSQKSHEVIENARNVIRKNSNVDGNHQTRRSKAGSMVGSVQNLDPIEEDASLEQSRI